MKLKSNKVLIDLERLRYPNSGIANVFKNLALGLSELSLLDHNIISLYGPEERIHKIGTDFSVVKRKPEHKIFPFFTFKYQITHTSHQLSSYFHFKKIGQKKIVTLHDLNFIHENNSDKKYKKELKKVKQNILNADVIVCISEFVKKDFLDNINLFDFCEFPKIEVVYNGIQFPDTQLSYSFENFHALKNKKYILNIGVLFHKKNQLSLIKMLPYIEEDLVLVVSGENHSYLKRINFLIQKLGVQNRVHFYYNITDEEKWALVQNCTSMCHPSIAEGFGIPPIEAMCFGKPVFLSDRTSLPEIGGDIAFYFKSFKTKDMLSVYKQGMNSFENNPVNMSKELVKRSKKFDYKSMAKSYLAVYNTLLN